MIEKPTEYFDWVIGRLAFAWQSYWMIIDFKDGTKWFRLGLGFYWRQEDEAND